MTAPIIKNDEVTSLIPEISECEFLGKGGQKIVFKVKLEGEYFALKFANCPSQMIIDGDGEEFAINHSEIRAKREIDIMEKCNSDHVIKLGPIGLNITELNGESLLYFSEELIDGNDLYQVLKNNKRLEVPEVIKLGIEITNAINELSEIGKVHRDIKPANIMKRNDSNQYVLLDAGLAFDNLEPSISFAPVGTPIYFSPEQYDFNNRRTVLDFRSDIFSLGVTMYHLLTGEHPFYRSGINSAQLMENIASERHREPKEILPDIPLSLNRIINRMLGKSPHLRYRSCSSLIQALEVVK